jgi:hypothetical protein
MDYLIVLLIGIAIGWLMTLFWLSIRKRWDSSKNLRGAYESTVKEIADKGKKAKETKRRSRDTAMRALIETTLFVVIVLVFAVLIMSILNIL